MAFAKRAYRGPSDQAEALRLALQNRASNLHVVDMPYRHCSWAFDDPENVGVWVDDLGRMLAFAVVQLPFQAFDIVLSVAPDPRMTDDIIKWAVGRVAELAEADQKERALYASVPEHDTALIARLEVNGFTTEPWSLVHHELRLDAVTPSFPPDGYAIRSLAGPDEVGGYVALHRAAFGTNNMTVGWRHRTLEHPLYVPDIDLVAIGPDGRLVAFCIGWIDEARRQGQIEPLGVHPDHQNAGLGGAMVREALSRLKKLGATSVLADAYSVGDAARATYESAGFRPTYEATTLAVRIKP